MSTKTNKILMIILLLGLALRVIGITYGLPLWLVGDEPPFVLSALKMIELKTLIPALYSAEFEKISYFPPYLAYLYILPFLIILAVKFVLFAESTMQFSQYLLLDLSAFFIAARISSAIAGILTVWIMYRVAKNLFHDDMAALLSAGFLSLSTMHILLSHWGRDWTYAVLLLTCAIYTLTRLDWSDSKRYYTSSVIAGIAFGFSSAAIFIPIFMVLYIFIYEGKKILGILKNKTLWISAMIFVGLALFSYILFPAGLFFTKTNSLAIPKTLGRLFETYGSFIKPFAYNDPILLMWSLIGLAILIFNRSALFWTFFLFINAYILSFFVTFHTGDRFVVYLYPIFTLLAGYALYWLREKTTTRISKNLICTLGAISFSIMLAQAVQVDRVLLKNDTRAQARQWIEQAIAPNTKIMTMASLTRLSSTPDAINEQEQIQSSSLRGADRSERALPTDVSYPVFHALNLYNVSGAADIFYKTIETYRAQHQYRFVLLSDDNISKDAVKNYARGRLRTTGTNIKTFQGVDIYGYDLTEGTIGDLKNLFIMNANGPTIHMLEYK
mgnify:FL=1